MRQVSELAYAKFIEHELTNNEFIGEMVRDKLIYYPTVTREPFRNQGRLTDVIESGKLLDARGFHISPRQGELGDYVIERAFVEK